MRRLISIIVITIFALWLVPLGVFIAPSKEKLLCDGQRAICLCSHMRSAKAVDKTMESGVALKAGASANKEKSGSGGGNYFVNARLALKQNPGLSYFLDNQTLYYQNPFLSSLEHIPKA